MEDVTWSRAARVGLFGAVAAVVAVAVEQPVAEAVRPSDDAAEVARVPARQRGAQKRLSSLAAEARAKPQDLASALALARGYLEAARRDGDPRYLGAAEAAIAAFRDDPPASVRVLRATILQSRHAFVAARDELDLALRAAPDDPQALLTRASIAMLLGEYEAARADCAQLVGKVSRALALSCRAPLDALSGQGEQARTALAHARESTRQPGERALLDSIAGELAYWRGDVPRAELLLRSALTLDAGDRYTRGVYADLLLDAGRAAEVATLVAAFPEDDALGLRAALAAHALATDKDDAEAQLARMAARFDAARLRGDAVHQREEARLLLVLGRPQEALARALETWSVQREPWDARVVLEAALAAGRPAAAEQVVRWLEATKFDAPHLAALGQRARARGGKS